MTGWNSCNIKAKYCGYLFHSSNVSNNDSCSIHNKLTALETHETSGGLKFDKKQHTRKTEEIVVFIDNGITGSKI